MDKGSSSSGTGVDPTALASPIHRPFNRESIMGWKELRWDLEICDKATFRGVALFAEPNVVTFWLTVQEAHSMSQFLA